MYIRPNFHLDVVETLLAWPLEVTHLSRRDGGVVVLVDLQCNTIVKYLEAH